ncbi:hypothetical protein HDZ31DRAFT_61989 [Schizophyllum fasciatum]
MSSASLPVSTARPIRDEDFYLDFLVFQVEDTLLRLPKTYFKQESAVFSDMFSMPDLPKASGVHDGCSDVTPLRVPPQVSLAEFHALAEILHPRTLQFKRSPELSKEQWIGVLKLSDLWMMDKIKALAVDALSPSLSDDPVTKVVLARAYQVPDWYYQGICKLVQRLKPLGAEELLRLGPPLAMKICELRECLVFRESTPSGVYGACGSWEMLPRRGYATCDTKVGQRVAQECALWV